MKKKLVLFLGVWFLSLTLFSLTPDEGPCKDCFLKRKFAVLKNPLFLGTCWVGNHQCGEVYQCIGIGPECFYSQCHSYLTGCDFLEGPFPN